MALWTPANIPEAANPFTWIDFTDSSTRTVETGISQLTDKFGNGNHATQTTAANQPAVSVAAVNGLDAGIFDGVNDKLNFATAILQPQSTLFLVFKPTIEAAVGFLFGQFAAGSTGRTGLACNQTSAGVTTAGQLNPFNSSSSSGAGSTGLVNHFSISNVPTIVAVTLAIPGTENYKAYKNDILQDSATITAIYTAVASALGGASAISGTYPFDGLILEMIALHSVASTELRQQIAGYLAWRYGTVADLAADHPYKSAAPTITDTTALLATLSQSYLLEGTLLTLLDQPYALTIPLLTKLEQFYGLQILTVLTQHYGDVPVVRQYLDQYYGSADLLRRILSQPYGNALQLRQSLVESWNLPGDLLAIMEMRYSISEGDLRALMSYNYDLSEYTLLRQKLEQIYIAGPDAEEAQEPLFSVTTNLGESLRPHHINIEIDEGEYAIKGEIHLADQNDFLLCKHIETEIIIPIDSTEYHLLVEGPRQSRPEWGRVEYYIPLASKTILLDSPYATPIDQEFTGALASVIVTDLAAIKSIAVIWRLIDWYIPTGVLTANNESPLSIIRRIINAVGGILQSSPAGELICLPEYPISTTEWETAAPDFYLTDMDNFFSVDSTSDIREGYNRFLISDKVIDESGLTLEQVDIDENTKDIYVYQVPWNPLEQVILHTSGGAWVSIVAERITTEEITEIVEIIAGEGMTQKPFYNKISHDYKETELGLITINEDKTVSTELSQNSLVEVVYNTKYWKFRVRDAEIEKVQFFPEAIAI